ncbi:MAG: c-type cytochrome biogenesis protein CcsB [Bacteroidales bacterium]|nr:c-type cytochrome biogenesis protein CcsB [Bacteroidales bacterium]
MKYLKFLISPIFMGILFVVFALAMAVATFLENDFGSPAAYSMVYNSFWFELILLLLAVNLVGQLIAFKLFKKSRITGALFHLAFVVMIIGAGITRYFGWEGSIHIREGEEQNVCYSTEKYIGYTIKASDGKVIGSNLQKYSLTSVTADNYNEKLTINNKEYELVLSKVIPNATEPGTMNTDGMGSGKNAFIFILSDGKESSTISIYDRSSEKVSTGSFNVNGTTVEVSYGSKMTTLPFRIRLNDFVLERYPGSSSPSGYKSDVVLVDKAGNVEKPFLIFMNNILKYKGYRFYQSSYDMDEMGTILSVNRDMAGMLVTYTGYALLIIFIILTLINKKSVFHNVNAGYWQSNIRKSIPLILLFIFLSGLSTVDAQKLVPDKAVAEEFGKVLVQDQKGRTKPLFTLSNDILRKVTRQNDFEGLSSMQVFLGIYLDFDRWKDVPMIRISNSEIQTRLRLRGKYAAFSDLVDLSGTGNYKISMEVNDAYAKAPGERSKQDKEIMKIDERVNILYMISMGDFMKLFPLKDGTHDWGSAEKALERAISKEDSVYLQSIMTVLSEAMQTNNMTTTKQLEESINAYQERFAGYELPSDSKKNSELLYYKMSIFERLFPFYATVGLIMLIGLITMVIKGRKETSVFVKVLGWLLFAGFLFHTLGLGLRWYIAGHSPMSNGYESMIFISWVTLLAGFIFSRKSAFALSATAVLASMTLMVAHLSFMDPEITNLVPVLKSYWLTLHVSVITGSYGFLGLGAILGLITLILLALSNNENRERIAKTIDELTVINYKTLTLGLYFLTIGTFLGAVWANESWGRYWGWDPKETWSLITVIIYSIVIHARLIPGMKDIFTFNLLSLFAFSSVLMTYFGVNYYLSGLHSYASGDSVPVPAFVYITVILLAALSFIASSKYSKYKK